MLFTPLAASLPATVPFVGPEALERRFGRPFAARLGANESVFGPSPNVVAAMRSGIEASWAYGDPEHHAVKAAIAAHHAIDPGNVAVGEGIDGLLGLIVRLTVSPGETVVTSRGAYPTFNFHVAGHGGLLDLVPYRSDDHEDVAALLERALATRPKILYVANPDNPTGTWHDAATIQRLIEAVPEETLLLLDEAYGDLAPEGTLPPLDLTRPNVLRLRTFSKAYGMAGVRVGYALGAPGTISAFDKVRNHFALSPMAQAGAVAALSDQSHLRRTLAAIAGARDELSSIARDAGLKPLASATNFVAIDCGGDGATARAILEGVLSRGVFIRMPGVAPLDRMIRVTVGRPHEMALFAQALRDTLRTL